MFRRNDESVSWMPSELLRDTWSGAEDALRRRLGDDVYARWFSGLTVLSASDGEISLGVANAWVQEWIETRYLVSITQALRELSDQDLCVSFSVDPYLYGKHRAEQKAVFGDDTLGSDGTESRRPHADERRADVWQGVVVPDFPPSADGEVEPTEAVRGAAGRQAASRAPGARPVQRSERGVQEVGAIRSLDDLVEGPSNLLAVNAARRLVGEPGVLFNPLFVYGPPGSGKSSIAKAIHGSFVAEQELAGRSNTTARCLSADRFAQHFAACAQDKTLRKFRQIYRTLALLIIDAIQVLASKRKTQSELLYTVEARVDSGRQVVLLADRRPQALEDLEPALISRCLGGLVTRLERPDYATRREIAHAHSLRLADRRVESSGRARTPWGAKFRRERDLVRGGDGSPRYEVTTKWAGALDDQTLDFLADRFRKSVHDLVGAVLRLDVHGRILGRSPTAQEAARVLADALTEQRRRVGVRAIQEQVADFFAVPIEELASRSRDRTIVFARQVGMYLARRYAGLSLREVGKSFGGRDPSTVKSAQKKISELLEAAGSSSSALARDVFAVIDRLGQDEPR